MLRRMIMIMRNNRIQMATLRQIKDRAKEDEDVEEDDNDNEEL